MVGEDRQMIGQIIQIRLTRAIRVQKVFAKNFGATGKLRGEFYDHFQRPQPRPRF